MSGRRYISGALAATLMILLLSGCLGAGRAPLGGDGEVGPTVGEVEIVGAVEVDEDDILEGLATRAPEGLFFKTRTPYDPVSVDLDRKRIESYYESRGFFSARVVDVKTRERDNAVDVTFQVEEGEPSRVVRVQASGVPEKTEIDLEALARRTDLGPGDVFDYDNYRKLKDLLRRRLAEEGYAFARVTGRVEADRQDRKVAVLLDADPGPLVRFGETRVEGLQRFPESAVLNRVAWKKGEIFDPSRIDLTRSRLYGLGFFSNVVIDYRSGGRVETANVVIRLTEGSRHEVRLGAGAGIDRANYQVRGLAGYTVRGFPDPLTTVSFEVRPAYIFLPKSGGRSGLELEATAAAGREDFLLPLLHLGGQVSYSLKERDAYSIRGPGFGVSLSHPFLDDRLTLSAGWQFLYGDFSSIHSAVSDAERRDYGMVDPYRLAYFAESAVYDRRDDPLETHKGFYLEGKLEEGGGFAGGKYDYSKATPEARGYVPLGDRVVLAARVETGFTLSGKGHVPITQRYFAGGASSQRGFSQQRLAPLAVGADGSTVPIGGEALFVSNWEARFDVFKLWNNWVGFVAFLDGADVTLDLGGLDLGHLHWAAGGGLRYQTPVGPVRFDFGYRLNRTGSGEPDPNDHYAYHISLGEAF